MQFGNYNCTTIVLDSFLLDGGAMFGVVPKSLWQKKIPANDRNQIPMSARSLVIKRNGRVILTDTGIGDKLPEKLKRIYGVKESGRTMNKRLSRLGLTVDSITDVILTHLHFDHAGGSTFISNGKIEPTFPNATYHIQKMQWDLACAPSVRDRSSYIEENFMPLMDKGVVNFVNGSVKNLFEGIDLIVTNGHTSGQQHPLVADKDHSLFFCADLIPTSAHIASAWHMAYDNHPLELMAEKDAILSRALNENWILCFEHDPVISAASILEDNGRVGIGESVVL
jgi:glyoxylase-like metal-dependent hydrolase (beta-lactamase superfamily II)